jgi:hypothetical protein
MYGVTTYFCVLFVCVVSSYIGRVWSQYSETFFFFFIKCVMCGVEVRENTFCSRIQRDPSSKLLLVLCLTYLCSYQYCSFVPKCTCHTQKLVGSSSHCNLVMVWSIWKAIVGVNNCLCFLVEVKSLMSLIFCFRPQIMVILDFLYKNFPTLYVWKKPSHSHAG